MLLQDVHIPKLLGRGQIHEGLHAFIVMSAGHGSLTPEVLRHTPALQQQALDSLSAVHMHGIIHGDVSLCNCVLSDSGNAVWLVDFADSFAGTKHDKAREQDEFELLLGL